LRDSSASIATIKFFFRGGIFLWLPFVRIWSFVGVQVVHGEHPSRDETRGSKHEDGDHEEVRADGGDHEGEERHVNEGADEGARALDVDAELGDGFGQEKHGEEGTES